MIWMPRCLQKAASDLVIKLTREPSEDHYYSADDADDIVEGGIQDGFGDAVSKRNVVNIAEPIGPMDNKRSFNVHSR